MEYLHEKFRHHHHVDEMTYHDDEKMKMRQNDVPFHDHFGSSSLFKSKRTHDSINNVINAIVKMRICFHDVSIETSQEHAIWKIYGWIGSNTFDSFDKEVSKIVLFLDNNTIQHVSKTSGEMVPMSPESEHILSNEFFPLLYVGA
ncbi:hypothetical protein Tco_1008975 [Tanacetum coccineum]